MLKRVTDMGYLSFFSYDTYSILLLLKMRKRSFVFVFSLVSDKKC